MRQVFSWHGVAAILLGLSIARWMWVLFAPASPSLPVTSAWKKNDDAGRLFGTAISPGAQAAPALANTRLIGVFAHPTRGFAVLQVDNRQTGVALGGEVSPGVRLVETNADHVILEYAGMRQRVDLQGTEAASGMPAATAAQPDASQMAVKAMDKLQAYQQNVLQQPSK